MKCRLCDGDILPTVAGATPRVCSIKSAVPAPECWRKGKSKTRAMCALSLTYSPTARFDDRSIAFRMVGEALDGSDMHIRAVLLTLTDTQRFELMRHACPELRVRLSPLLADLELTLKPIDRAARVPADLPEGLKDKLSEYKERLLRRQALLVKRGHERSHRYIDNLMIAPVRLARYLNAHGITSWDAMRKRDMVAFLEANPLVRPTALARFLRALTENEPFAERRGRYDRTRKASKATPLQDVLPPEELQRLLDDIKDASTEVEFIAAWLVGQLGMSASAARRLTADRLHLNTDGRLVIRPAEVWVVVPKAIARVLTTIADEAAPGWREAEGEALSFVRLFDGKLPGLDDFRRDVLRGKSRLMRASAIYAAMLRGHLDRVTLHKTMGVSHATIASIERHISSDVHRKLDRGVVEARNKVLRGDDDATE